MTDIIVGPVQTLTDPVVLDEPGDSLEVQGRVDVAGDDPAVVTQSVLNVVETVDVAPGPLVAIADTLSVQSAEKTPRSASKEPIR